MTVMNIYSVIPELGTRYAQYDDERHRREDRRRGAAD